MKKKINIFFICLVCCSILQADAQTNDNTIVNDNSSWGTLYYSYITYTAHTEYTYFEGDTIVAGNLYKKVFSCNDKLHENIKLKGLIREENKKTYFFDLYSSVENIVYDFSLVTGDTLMQVEGLYIYIESCDTIMINGKQKKRMILSGGSFFRDTVIENVGSLGGILYPTCYMCVGAFNELLCYSQNDEVLYKNPKYSECYYDTESFFNTIDEINEQNTFSIFPNPANDILFISSKNENISQIEIFDVSGKKVKVYSQTHKDTIDVSSFSKGLYLLKIYDTSKQVSMFKIIKK